jgi:leader peptidase (prepilin peptidase)/N-methyltransferase
MGMMLGWPGVVVAIFLAYMAGAVVGLVLMAARRKGWKSEIAFGTFLAASTALTLLWGQELLTWYLGSLL